MHRYPWTTANGEEYRIDELDEDDHPVLPLPIVCFDELIVEEQVYEELEIQEIQQVVPQHNLECYAALEGADDDVWVNHFMAGDYNEPLDPPEFLAWMEQLQEDNEQQIVDEPIVIDDDEMPIVIDDEEMPIVIDDEEMPIVIDDDEPEDIMYDEMPNDPLLEDFEVSQGLEPSIQSLLSGEELIIKYRDMACFYKGEADTLRAMLDDKLAEISVMVAELDSWSMCQSEHSEL